MALSGKYISGAIERTEDGKLRFSETFEGYLKAKKAKYVGEFITAHNAKLQDADKIANLNDKMKYLGKICPVANIGGGIDMLAAAYAQLQHTQK
jgi:hypothetical protein